MKLSILVSMLALGLATLVGATSAAAQPWFPQATSQAQASTRVQYRTTEVRGIKIFYREAGDPKKPTLLLLHGFPSSSHMYRELIPLLAKDFHLIAPDYPGAGFSDYPSADKFVPTFENLAELMSDFVEKVGLSSFILYMQDFGGPVGFRMAVKHPEWVKGLIIQNANAYIEGIAPEMLKDMQARAGQLTPEQRKQVDHVVSRGSAVYFYKTGARNFGAMDPTGWNLDSWVLDNADVKRIQAELIINYYSNFAEYPRWQEFLRTKQPKTLIVWGKNDPLFLPPGAEAYKRDVPKAQLRFYNTGHFALEEDAPAIAGEIRKTFARK